MKNPKLPDLTSEQKDQILCDDKPLAITALWKQSPCALTTLWEIVNTLNAVKFARTWELLYEIKSSTEAASSAQPESLFDENRLAALTDLSERLREIWEVLKPERAFEQILNIEDRIFKGPPFLNKEIAALLWAMDEKLMCDFHQMIFVQIPKAKAEFYDKAGPFGDVIAKKFEESARELKWARTCMAMELYTAAVYHLTRAAEAVLLDVAARCGIKKTLSGDDIDAACWGPVIAVIRKYLEDEIARLGKGGPRTKAKANRLKLFQTTNRHLKEIKDLWRDPASHGIEVYDESTAQDAYKSIEQLLVNYAKNGTRKF